MFYEVDLPESQSGLEKISAMVVLNPAESRRLLAKATVACQEFQRAWKEGKIILARGITNAYVSEELFDITIENKAEQTAGLVGDGFTTVNSAQPPCTWHVIKKGQVVENADSNQEIQDFRPGDIFVKGANAVDSQGNAGIYVASLKAGTIGMAWPILTARRCDLLIPVSLEKMVFSVNDSATHTGLFYYTYSTGLPATLIPVPLAKVITEIQALGILFGLRAYHVGSGGIAGSEGSVHLSIEGERDKVEKAFECVKSIKGETPVAMSDHLFLSSPDKYNYNSAEQLATLKGV